AVIIVVMLLMPLRVASVAASTIPITIFLSLLVFYACGLELNTVTLAALIATLGMIVDNSIVIIDCYMEKLDSGIDRWTAAIESAKEFFKSILSATLAISITFFPFLITSQGMINDFLQSFPWAITIILFLSLLVAVLLVPYMQYHFIHTGFRKQPKEEKKQRRSFLTILQSSYDKLIVKCFAHPIRTMGVGLLSIVAGVVIFLSLPMKLMPFAERNQFAVEIYMPFGTALEQTAAVADSLESILRQDNRVVSVASFKGDGSPRFHTSYAPQMPGSNYAQFIVNTIGNKATEEMIAEYKDKYLNYFPNVRVRFKQLEYSEAAYPIEMRVKGNNRDSLRLAADKVKSVMSEFDGLSLVHDNWEGQLPGVSLRLKDDEMSRLGINKALLSTGLSMHLGNGLPVTTVWDGDYPIDVVLKDGGNIEPSYEDVGNQYVSAWGGTVSVPVRQIADIEPDWHDAQIAHRNGIPSISIQSDVKEGFNAAALTKEIVKAIEKIDLPDGVDFEVGGSEEADNEMLDMILSGLFISIVVIFFILLFHFRRINMALLVLGSISLCLLGAALGIWVMGLDVSVTAVLGIVSLMGILVRNGIIMLDYADELREKEGLTVREAALHSAKRRMRPIFLTSAAASMGVIPMILGGSPLWSPMGSVVFFGTIVSMVLTVTILPVAYWLIFSRADRKSINH
ncbi:MAG: efflux RND transporter permease subunit, partial [Barnesiella intestinihominis]